MNSLLPKTGRFLNKIRSLPLNHPIMPPALIKEAYHFGEIIDHILKVRESTLPYLAVALDVTTPYLTALYQGKQMLPYPILVKLCQLYGEACLYENKNWLENRP